MNHHFRTRLTILNFAVLTALAFGAENYHEPFRPQFHFTPERNWMNDPNGLVFFEGEYHLFYQYNPYGDKWGHMSWGHAVSRDLVHWEHLPLALAEEDGVMIFSGSAVVDWKNTSGFGIDGKPPLVAIYTGHRDKHQDQRIAYSNDRGRTWTKYAANPVLDLGMADFRDPKVYWHEPTQHWFMVVALPMEKKVHFYTSSDLKQWKYSGEFGPAGSTSGIWECPDLFPVTIEGEVGATKWVLIVNINPGGPAGGSGCQYFVGEFDGRQFVADAPAADSAEKIPAGRILADFENGNYAGWTKEGDAFGDNPATGTLPHQQPVTGFRGHGLVNTFRDGDRAQGTLTSPEFEIKEGYISFLIGGGAFPGETCVNLRVDGNVARTATGDERERLSWKSWDVRDLRGKRARIEVVDHHSGGWGHINLDHILLTEEPARPAAEDALWAEFGPDFYAAVSWSNTPDGRRIFLAWMSNGMYAHAVPTTPWRSAMTIPRTLTLRRTPAGLRLIQQPIAELQELRAPEAFKFAGGSFADAAKWLDAHKNLPELLDVEMTFARVSGKAPFTVNLHTGNDELTALTFDLRRNQLSVDRTKSGQTAFHKAFPARHEAPLHFDNDSFSIRLLLDISSIEVFANNGETAITELIFPATGPRRLSITSGEGPTPAVPNVAIHSLRSAW
jgi:sucrose-6-phosphate hydrolase SacC (GH32 family)